jgi:hypothetical protein
MEKLPDGNKLIGMLESKNFVANDMASYALQTILKLIKPPTSARDVLFDVPPNTKSKRMKAPKLPPIISSTKYSEALKDTENKKKEDEANKISKKLQREENAIQKATERQDKIDERMLKKQTMAMEKAEKLKQKTEEKLEKQKAKQLAKNEKENNKLIAKTSRKRKNANDVTLSNKKMKN